MPPGALPADRKTISPTPHMQSPDSPASCGVNRFDGHRFNGSVEISCGDKYLYTPANHTGMRI